MYRWQWRKWLVCGMAAVVLLSGLLVTVEQKSRSSALALGAPGSAQPGTPVSATPAYVKRLGNGSAEATTSPQTSGSTTAPSANAAGSYTSLQAAFSQAARDYGVPMPLLQALCYMEGRLSNHNGSPSIDSGYGCMHLVHNDHADTLDQAARDTHTSVQQLQIHIEANVQGGAAVLRDEALRYSVTHTLPTTLGDWYGAVAAYSGAQVPATARLYADTLYKLLRTGFSSRAETGETITLAPQSVSPNPATFSPVAHALAANSPALPAGCTNDGNVDYAGAIDCVLNPNVYDCNIVAPGNSTNPCTYTSANRPTDLAITFVVIHDIEGTAADAISTFQDVNSLVSCHYVVDSDGTVYQIVRDKDIAFHAGNWWYNEHAIGIEHAGFDATGYQWYNATEYLASAKLAAFLLQTYNIPLDRAHVVAHGTIPSPTLQTMPNHVDPGPYWLWDYYFGLIHQQGVPFGTVQGPVSTPSSVSTPTSTTPVPWYVPHMLLLQPTTDQQPFGSGGTETSANFNFFHLYTGTSTKDALIPPAITNDITDETTNVEPAMPFYYVAAQPDAAGTGDTMYEIWYGESDNLSSGSQAMNGHLAWLAVPPGAASISYGRFAVESASGGSINVYGRPTSSSSYVIGNAPGNALFVSTLSTIEDGTTTLWYEIDYNHRQSWVPASEVIKVGPAY